MEVQFCNYTGDSSWSEDFFKSVTAKTISVCAIAPKAAVSFVLVGAKRIRQLNWRYRKKNKVTDVLSFPFTGAKKQMGISRSDFPARLFSRELVLGDVLICLPVAKKQSHHAGITVEQQVAYLAAHGLLHLLGYDHVESAQAQKTMTEIEHKVMQGLDF